MSSHAMAPIFDAVGPLAETIRRAGAKRVVLGNGCFDPLHVGHVRYLNDARSHGDFLVVALNGDASTHRLKGEGRPVVPELDRAVVLCGLTPVDAVLIFNDDNVEPILEALRPDVHAKGTDYSVDTVPEIETARRLGIETVIVGDPKAHASRDVLGRIRGGKGASPSE